jgi:hypothetical protein
LSKADSKKKSKRTEETIILNLNKRLNTILVHKIFSSRPFNLDLPKINDVTQTETEFLTSISEDDKKNWFTFKPFYHCWQNKMQLDTEGGVQKGYFLLSNLTYKCYYHASNDKLMKHWSKSPAPTLLIDMMFTVLGNANLFDTFNKYIQAFEGTTHYYDPLWLAVYVFYPITSISSFYKDYYFSKVFEHDITQQMQGKCAPAKNKLMITIKTLLLQEYFNTLILFGGKNIFNDLESYKFFSKAQDKDITTSTGGFGLLKKKYVAYDFLEMVLLTLPEKLYERISLDDTNKFIPFKKCNFHWMSGIHLRNTKGRTLEDIKRTPYFHCMPTIEDLLPSDIIPMRMMKDKQLATAYTTKCLTSLQTESQDTPKKRKAANITSPESASKKKARNPANQDEDYTQEDQDADEQAEEEEEHQDKTGKPTPSMVLCQVLRLKIRLLRHTFLKMNAEIQAKSNITKQIKTKQDNFATLLEILHEPDDVFKPHDYTPESNMQNNEAIQTLEYFYDHILETLNDTGEFDDDYDKDNKFLLYIFSDLPSMDSISVPQNIDEVTAFLQTIKQKQKNTVPDSPANHTRNQTNK